MLPQIKPAALEEVASGAWEAVGSALDAKPSEGWLRDRYWAARAYEAAYDLGEKKLKTWSATVAKGGLVPNFGSEASAMISEVPASEVVPLASLRPV